MSSSQSAEPRVASALWLHTALCIKKPDITLVQFSGIILSLAFAKEAPIKTRPNQVSMSLDISRVKAGSATKQLDRIAVEEPLEIRLDGKSVAVVMRSPGNDVELACGFLFTETILKGTHELNAVHPKRDAKHPELCNVIDVRTSDGIDTSNRGWQRNFVSASSCGLCGKLTIESVRIQAPPLEDPLEVTSELLYTLPDKMLAEQEGFGATGAVHAAGLFDARGKLLYLREDIGRHNAVDKLIGQALLDDRLPLGETILIVSGRASFEIVQKALVARIPVIAGVSAASSLAVEMAASSQMALVGFLRGKSMNIYTGTERILPSN